ncbi:MAG: O-antigen ligase family protein [bacterium]
MASWLILGIAALLLLIVSWRNPRYGLWAVILTLPLYLWQFKIGPIPTNWLEIAIYILTLTLVVKRWPDRRNWLKVYQPIQWPVGLLLAGLVIGAIVTPDLRLGLGIFKGWFIDPLILYGLVVNLIERDKLRNYIATLAITTLPISSMAIWQAITRHFITVDGRASAWFVSANYLSMYLVPAMLLAIILIASRDLIYKILGGAAIGFGLVALYFSFSYGGWLALLAALVLLAAAYFRKHWRLWIWGGLLPIGLIVSQLNNPKLAAMLNLSEKSSASVRLQVWQSGWLMIREHWLTGIGLGQFRDQYLRFAERLWHPPLELAILHAHNVYLQFWINTGIIGLAAWLWLIARFFAIVGRQTDLVGSVLLAAGSAILIHGLIDTTYWKNDLAAVFWLIVGLAVVWANAVPATRRPHQ